MDRALFGRKRINMGAYEASLLADVPLCGTTEPLLPRPRGFLVYQLRGILLGFLLIPIMFYTYNGVIGKSPDWINIAIFFLSAAIAYIYETRLFHANKLPCRSPKYAIAILCAIVLLLIVFTFWTPEIGIFRDPLTGGYGI